MRCQPFEQHLDVYMMSMEVMEMHDIRIKALYLVDQIKG